MKTLLLLTLSLALAGAASAQNIILKDGRTIVVKGLRRQGDQIIATQEVQTSPTTAPTTGEFGYPLSQIEKLDFPEPGALRQAADLLTVGKGTEALAALEPVVRYYEAFRDAPGSWWADATVLKLNTLVSLGKDAEAAPLIDQLSRFASDPEIILAARVQQAANLTRRGKFTDAVPVFEKAFKEATRGDTLATAAIYKGQCHLALKEPYKAMVAFLQIPVFYPEQRVLIPASILGRGRAHFAMEDFENAKKYLNELISTYGGTKEAADAKTELANIEKREKALAAPK